jgi:hydroxyacylglutathione hydrolase
MTDTLCDLVDLTIVVDPTFDQNCYVLHRRDTDHALVIDPGLQHRAVLDVLESNGWACDRILITHGHPDHVNGVPMVREAHGCPAAIHPDDRELLDQVMRLPGVPPDLPPVVCDEDLVPGTAVAWQGLAMDVLHTPGHTRGSVCFRFRPGGGPERLVAGDTLFRRGVGRTDLPGGSWPALVFSIENVLYTLPPETVVHPGHGESTTIGEEMTGNPFVVHPRYR